MPPEDVAPEHVEAFLASPNTSNLAKKQLSAFLEDIPIHDTTEDCVRDMDRRLNLIRQLQENIHEIDPELKLNLMQLGLLLELDLSKFPQYLRKAGLQHMIDMLGYVEPFVKACLCKSNYLNEKSDKPTNKRSLSVSESPGAKRAKSDDGGRANPVARR